MNKNLEQSLSDGNRPQYRFMKYRIHKILLVCSATTGIFSKKTDISSRRSIRSTST